MARSLDIGALGFGVVRVGRAAATRHIRQGVVAASDGVGRLAAPDEVRHVGRPRKLLAVGNEIAQGVVRDVVIPGNYRNRMLRLKDI